MSKNEGIEMCQTGRVLRMAVLAIVMVIEKVSEMPTDEMTMEWMAETKVTVTGRVTRSVTRSVIGNVPRSAARTTGRVERRAGSTVHRWIGAQAMNGLRRQRRELPQTPAGVGADLSRM